MWWIRWCEDTVYFLSSCSNLCAPLWPAVRSDTTKWYSCTSAVHSSGLKAWSCEPLYNIVFEENVDESMCKDMRVFECVCVCGLHTKASVASWGWQMAPASLSLSASWVQSQAKETHMVHRWKAMPAYDAGLLLCLIYEDKPVHKTWNYSLSSLNSLRKETLTGLDCTDLLSHRNRVFLCVCVEAIL